MTPTARGAAPASPITRPRRATVVGAHLLGPRLRRLSLASADLLQAAPIHAGAHIKLLIPEPGREPLLPIFENDRLCWPEGPRSVARTYSVRRHDAERGTLDVEFVLHGDSGPASRWAQRASLGDAVGLAGPGGPELFRGDADFHLLAGDLSALPAIAAVLEALPLTACGVAVVEITDDADRLPLRHPPGIRLQWLRAGRLVEAVRAIPWPPLGAFVSATVAGESDAVLAIRRQLLHERSLPKAALYAVPYWQRGANEEQYHAERHRQMDEEE